MRLISSLSIAAPFLVLLGSCVGPAQERAAAPAQPARPRPPMASQTAPAAQASPAPVALEWQYRPAQPGDWTYRTDAAGSAALFGTVAGTPQLSVRCDRAARRVSLIRAGAGADSGTAMTVRTSYGATSLPITPASAVAPQTLAIRAAADTLLDQIAYSRGKIAIEVAGLPPLIVPAWAEIARVTEDCRG